MHKYFTIEGFDSLIALLEYHEDFDNDIEKLQELKPYNYYELSSGDYETENFKIRVIERYIDEQTSVSVYEVTSK